MVSMLSQENRKHANAGSSGASGLGNPAPPPQQWDPTHPRANA